MKKQYKDIVQFIVKKWWMVVCIAVLATFSLSLFMGLGQSIWFDEGYSILLAKRPLAELIALTNVDAHPPLYYILLKGWAGLFGWSELALRSLSAVLMAGVVGVAILLVKRLFSVKIALSVAPLLVVAPFLLRYGYEVRMYALASFIGIVGSYLFSIAMQKKSDKRLWVAYGLFVALGMYTLYMTLVVWLAHFVWLVFHSRSKKQLVTHPALIGFGAAVVFFLPQLPVFVDQTLHSALPGVGTELTLTKLVSVLSVLTLYTPEWNIGGWYSLLLIAGMILFGLLYATAIKDKAYRSGLFFVATLVVVPLVFYALSSLPPRQPIFIERYMAHVAVYVYLMVALVAVIGFLGRRRVLAWSFAGVIAITSVTGLVRLQSTGNLNLERMQLPQTRQLRADIPCDTTTTIVADDPYTYIDSVYYFTDCNLVFYSKDPLGFRGGYAPLAESTKRISSPDQVTTQKLVHLHWLGADPSFVPSTMYHQTSEQTYEKQVVTIYEQ